MKRLFSSLIIMLLVFSLVSCSNSYIIDIPEENSHPDFSDLPYLLAIQNSLDRIFDQDESGYWNTQEPSVETMYINARDSYIIYKEDEQKQSKSLSEIKEEYTLAMNIGNFKAYADCALKDLKTEDSFIKILNSYIKEYGIKNKITGIEERKKEEYEADFKDTLKDIYDVEASEVRYIRIFLSADESFGEGTGSKESVIECNTYLVNNQWYAYFDISSAYAY